VSSISCEQPERLGVVGHQPGQQAAQADRLLTQVRPGERLALGGGVALGEDDRDRREDAGQPLGQQLVGRDAVRDAGRGDLALGPGEALAHRRLGDQERPCGLRRAQAAERLHGQRHPGGEGQRRMAAGEDEAEPVVGEGARFVHGGGVGWRSDGRAVAGRGRLERAHPVVERARPAQAVDRLVARHGGQPRGRDGRDAVARPGEHGGGEGVLQRVLGQLEVAAEVADQGRERDRAVLADGPLQLGGDRVGHSKDITGRTSTEP
jgi:hypothetical protein